MTYSKRDIIHIHLWLYQWMLPFEHFFLKYVPCLLRSSELTIVICKVPQFAIVDHGWFADMVRQWKDRQWSSPVKCMGKDTSLSGHRPHSIRLVVCYCSSTTSWWARPGLTMYYTRLQWRELSEVCRRSRWIRLSMDAFCLAPGLFGISSGWHVVYRRSLAWTSSFSRLSKLRDGQYETAMVLSRSRNWCAGSGREIWRPDGIEGRGRERARSDRIVASDSLDRAQRVGQDQDHSLFEFVLNVVASSLICGQNNCHGPGFRISTITRMHRISCSIQYLSHQPVISKSCLFKVPTWLVSDSVRCKFQTVIMRQ